MSNTKQFLDDFLKLTGSAMNTAVHSAGEAKQQLEQWINAHVKDILARCDMVKREEFEVVRQMAETIRLENEMLKKRLDALEEKSSSHPAKPATRKATKKI